MSEPEGQATPEPLGDEEREVRIRRAPRLLPFLLTGAGIGLLVAAIVAATTPASADVSQLQAFGYLAIVFVVGFGAIAGIVVIILDAVLARRSRNAVALVEEVDEPVALLEADEPVAPIATTEPSSVAGADDSSGSPSNGAVDAAPHGDSEPE